MVGHATAAAPLTIRVRRATASDTEAVARFTRATWDGWDYIPDVWASWLASSAGLLLVAETDLEPGRPIAIGRGALLSADEGWLEGLRVDPDVRGRGVAIALQHAQLAWIQAQGVSVVRYATGDTNEASLHLGAKHGFVEAGRWRALRPEAIGSGRHAAAPDDERLAVAVRELSADLRGAGVIAAATGTSRAWERLRSDPTFVVGERLYEWRAWAWQRLDRDRLAGHAGRSELLEARDGDGWALGLVAGERLHGETRVAILGGDAPAARRLVDAVTAAAGRPPVLRVPDASPLLAGLGPGLAASGWRIGEHVLVLMRRSLRDQHGEALPLPEEGGDRVEYLERPHRLGLVPAD